MATYAPTASKNAGPAGGVPANFGSSPIETSGAVNAGSLKHAGVTLSTPVKVVEMTIAEAGAAGVYTASVTIPAGSVLIDVIVHNTVAWTAGTSATLKVGDATNDDGIFEGVDLKALTATFGLDTHWVDTYEGADFTHGTYPDGIRKRMYLAAERIISAIVTTVGTTATAGRTRVYVLFFTPATADTTAATYVAS